MINDFYVVKNHSFARLYFGELSFLKIEFITLDHFHLFCELYNSLDNAALPVTSESPFVFHFMLLYQISMLHQI